MTRLLTRVRLDSKPRLVSLIWTRLKRDSVASRSTPARLSLSAPSIPHPTRLHSHPPYSVSTRSSTLILLLRAQAEARWCARAHALVAAGHQARPCTRTPTTANAAPSLRPPPDESTAIRPRPARRERIKRQGNSSRVKLVLAGSERSQAGAALTSCGRAGHGLGAVGTAVARQWCDRDL